MSLFTLKAGETLDPPEEILAFVEQILNSQYEEPTPANERRTERRFRVTLPVSAVPIDASLRPIGETFTAVSRNISTRGIALLYTRHVEAQFLALRIKLKDQDPVQAAMEVLRCRRVGPFFEIAGKFVAKIYGKPTDSFHFAAGDHRKP